jgi:hypothetical protein
MLLIHLIFLSFRNPVVKFTSIKTVVGKLMAPDVAYFSSRGPSSLSPFVLKVKIIAKLNSITIISYFL